MTQTSRPWQSTAPGDAGPYSAADWQQLYQYIIGWGGLRSNVGVFLGSGTQPNDGLKVQAQSPVSASIDILPGAALVQGLAYINTAIESKLIAANASGNPRIDTLVIRKDYALQTARLTVIQGTPAASPVAPALTQSAGIMWDLPLADIAVANGFTTLAQATITPRHEWVNAPPGVYLDNVLNNSGVTLEDGDVVIWDSSADRAVTVTTVLNNRLVAGVWRGRTANGAYGRVQQEGIGYVRASAAVTRGDLLVTSATSARAVTATRFNGVIGRALETIGSAGFVLAAMQVHRMLPPPFAVLEDQKATNTAGGALVATTWTTRVLNTEVVDADGIVTIASDQFTPIAGVYRLSVTSNFVANAAAATFFRIRIRNVTAGTVVQVSANFGANAGDDNNAFLETSFVANGTDAYDLQYYSTQARATNGLGIAINEASAVERYSQIYLEKIG
jgi:hypothetical protein